MKKKAIITLFFFGFSCLLLLGSEKDLKAKFPLKKGELHLSRSIHPQTYFESVGQKSAVLGRENGTLEIWVYPYKVCHNFRLYFLLEEENALIDGSTIARKIEVYPHQAILRYVHSSFTVEEIFFAPLREAGVVILLSVEAIKPLSIIASFTPDLKLMWPAGLGGQYSYWHDEKKYFVISEGTRKNIALVGSPAGQRFSTGPAHALPEGDMKIKIPCDKERAGNSYFPLYIAASHEGSEQADMTYARLIKDLEHLYLEKFQYYERLREEFLSVRTPDEKLNQAFEWAKVAVDKAFVCNPQLGCGLVAGYGLSGGSERPGFAWFFGGDAFFNSWALNSYGSFDITRQGLQFIRNNQRDDGKIMHELSQAAGFIPWFEKYPYGFYHADTTPYYLVSLHDYLLSSGDMEFLKESWPSVKKAYQYILSADTDKDGLMESPVAGLAALELGSFLGKTKTDIYLAALSVESYKALRELASLMGEKKLAQEAEERHKIGLKALQEKFYDKEKKQYMHAVTVKDTLLPESTIWTFMPLFFKQIPQEKAFETLDIFASSEMSTDWGVRSLSPKSAYYDPLNYNYGSVWPFLTGYTCLAEYNYDRTIAGFSHLMNLAHNTFIDALGYCPELFSGEFFTPIEESVPHQVFSSSPVVTCLVRGLLGLRGNALGREIEIRPNLPVELGKVEVKNFRLGKDVFHFDLEKYEDRLILRIKPLVHAPYELHLSPSLGFGARIKSVRVNGKPSEFEKEGDEGEIRCSISLKIENEVEVEIEHEGSISLSLPPCFPQIGDIPSGLKIVRTFFRNNQLHVVAEGIGGKEYLLHLFTSRPLQSLEGAEVVAGEKFEKKLKVSFDKDKTGYSRKEIIIGV